MLKSSFLEVYTKFKLNFYRGIFERLKDREGSLSAAEAYAAEVIHALDGPTVSEFAHFLQVSGPNATYKVNSLIKKGYVKKVKSKEDGRKLLLYATPKFMEYYAINQNYIDVVMDRINNRFTQEELAKFDEMLTVISTELMVETGERL